MSEELPDECCAKCRFGFLFEPTSDDFSTVFTCKRHPPQWREADDADLDNWFQPLTYAYDWCGEFQPRKDTP